MNRQIRAKALQTMIANQKIKAELIYSFALEFYEEGNQSKSFVNVWRLHVQPKYGISYRTFLRYIKIARRNRGESVTINRNRNG